MADADCRHRAGPAAALGLSEARGIDVDSPRGLHKVTLTE